MSALAEAAAYSEAARLQTLIYRLSSEDMNVVLAYTALLRLPLTHPVRANGHAIAVCRDYMALILNQDAAWVQRAFEQRAKELT